MIQDKKGHFPHTDKLCLVLVRFLPRNSPGYASCLVVTVRVSRRGKGNAYARL